MALCEPVLDLSVFCHGKNGIVRQGSFPEVNVACSQSDASEVVGLEADSIVILIFVLDLKHSCFILKDAEFEQTSDSVVWSSIIIQ